MTLNSTFIYLQVTGWLPMLSLINRPNAATPALQTALAVFKSFIKRLPPDSLKRPDGLS